MNEPQYRQTALWLQERLPSLPTAAVVLGTGLGDLVPADLVWSCPYSGVPGFRKSTAPSHKGILSLGLLKGQAVLYLQGRFHYYEGYSMAEVVFPIRVLAALGVKILVLTNASGSLREDLPPGSIVLLEDHINHMGVNPLIGPNDASLGERFPSLNNPYDPDYLDACAQVAREQGISLFRGVYIAVAGPSLETKAECTAFASWGADLVGMSTVPEVIAARHAGLRVLALSVVTNFSNLFHDEEHSQEEIARQAASASQALKPLIEGFLHRVIRTR